MLPGCQIGEITVQLNLSAQHCNENFKPSKQLGNKEMVGASGKIKLQTFIDARFRTFQAGH